MSRNLIKKKKSTSKYRKFKVSPLIPAIAALEAVLLIAISTFAWFTVSQEKEANTGVISVDADSGLDIDFKNGNYDDEINIWDYVEDDFRFEPVTSLDGRNIYIPTSGTFDKVDTNNITFRDATINDINTKYLNVDFMLTNTASTKMDVFLSNKSVFKVWDGANERNSRALRLAFYKNDGNHGKVSSSILSNTQQENIALAQLTNKQTVYFQKPDNWSTVYAYMWKNSGDYAVSWPGSIMTHVAGKVYSYTFSNTAEYNKIVFSNGTKDGSVAYNGSNESTCTQTRDLTISNGKLYKVTEALNSTGTAYTTKTVYFVKPSGWSGVRAHAFKTTGQSTSFTNWPGDECTYVGADIYSYTFPASYNSNNMGGIVFNNLANENQKTSDIYETMTINLDGSNKTLSSLDGKLFYISNNGNSGTCAARTYSDSNLGTVYFYNSQGFSNPYAKVTSVNGHVAHVPMTNLSAGVYYTTIPTNYYTQIAFEDGANQTVSSKYTRTVTATKGYMYRPQNSSTTGWTLNSYSYSGYAEDGNYAVISPGVSAGFQRSYTPVVGITNSTGSASQLVPAFASSLDAYLKASKNPMFTLEPGESIDLSMIVWLEGTDADCTAPLYAGKGIQLDLYFSTTNTHYAGIDDVSNYTFRFYDKTREVWTSDRLTNSAGVSVSPVMQLYDATDKRGYLMHAASVTNVYSELYGRYMDKIDLWECDVPSVDTSGNAITEHDLYFRRVDPYNEDEVWNYWHPATLKDYFNDAKSTLNGNTYVNFTAFADGAPASSTQDSTGISLNTTVLSAASTASTPARSCGGLWGTYETKLLSVIDGTNGRWLSGDNARLTLRYTYKYPSGKTMQIEYISSGYTTKPYGISYFVVPTTLLNNTNRCSEYTVHRFWGFNPDYAMNIYERNSNMSFNTSCSPSITTSLKGYYLWLSQTPSSTSVNKHWFGTDLTYINLSYKDSDSNQNIMNGAIFRAHVWNNSGGVEDINLYQNHEHFQLSNFNGYIIVAPSGYTGMQLQRSENTSWSSFTLKDESFNLDISSYRNFVATKWQNDNKHFVVESNNLHTTYGWPVIPSYWYKWD